MQHGDYPEFLKLAEYNLSCEQLESFVSQLRFGDKTVIDLLILSQVRMAYEIARRAENRYPQYRGELFEIALFTLVKKVHDAEINLTDNNIVKYLAKSIAFALRSYIQSDQGFWISGRTIRDRLSSKKEVPFKRQQIPDSLTCEQQELSVFDYEHLCTSDFELEIMRLRLERYDDYEIAKLLGVVPRLVFEARRKIGERYVQMQMQEI